MIADAQSQASRAPQINNLVQQRAISINSRRLRFWWNTIAFPHDGNTLSQPTTRWTASQRLIASGILIVAAFILFTNLGYPLLEPDEARNAQIGFNVYQSGEWMSLTLDGDHYWDKPPLQAWMTAISYHLLGPSELSTRLPCVIVSLTTVLAILLLGSRLFGFRAACFSAIALPLCAGFTVVARYTTTDASLCCFATVMYLSLLLATDTQDQLKKRWLILAGVACGMGLLAKGPVICVVVLPPVLVAGWLREQTFFRRVRFWALLLSPAILIAAPWFLAMSIVHPGFVSFFFWKHHVVRFADAFNHDQPWWFYLPVFLIMTYPAVFALPAMFRMLVSSDRECRQQFGRSFGPMVVYVLWIVGFFSLADAKLPTYILPSIPVLCLLIGRTLDLGLQDQLAFHRVRTKMISIPRTVAISVLISLAGCVAYVGYTIPDVDSPFIAVATIALLAHGILLLFVLLKRESANGHSPLFLAIVTGVVFIVACNGLLIPAIADGRSSQNAVHQLVRTPEHRAKPVVFFGRPPHATFLLLPNTKVKHFDNDNRLKAVTFLATHTESIVVASATDIEILKGELNHSIAFTAHDSHRKLFVASPVFKPTITPNDSRTATEVPQGLRR